MIIFKMHLFLITLGFKCTNFSKLLIAHNDDHRNIVMALNLSNVLKQ